MLSQFSQEGNRPTLKELNIPETDIYPIGRLDADSEGLLLLSNDSQLNNRLLNPSFAHKRRYWVQVDGAIDTPALKKLSSGPEIRIKKRMHKCKACLTEAIPPPNVQERVPPVRFRANIPTSWISLELEEGKNRQVRRMTAAVGFPTLRLIRYSIENLHIDILKGQDRLYLSKEEVYNLCCL